MIKYLGSKRTLIPVLSQLAEASGAKTALDLFTGTTRVAQAFKKLGMNVTASDVASYAECFGKTWIELDGDSANHKELAEALAEGGRLLHSKVLRRGALLPAKKRRARRRHP